MKKLMTLLLITASLISCGKEDGNESITEDIVEKQYILGQDNLSLFLQGKVYKYTIDLYLDGDRIRIIQFGDKAKRNVMSFCGANGENCNTDPRGSCYMSCISYSTNTILLESPNYLEYGDGYTITVRGGKLYFQRANTKSEYELIESSVKEIEDLKSQLIYECDPNSNC